ncbi:hypothetical protein T492DRAFT_834741 [Pavlovales sp. CCMP2436]|nr:hypothetical protein T492DRAFT_834741 [Pavlovales sp. CCMP2436]
MAPTRRAGSGPRGSCGLAARLSASVFLLVLASLGLQTRLRSSARVPAGLPRDSAQLLAAATSNTAHVLTASRERARFTSAPPPPTGLGVRGVAVERTTASAGTGARVQPHASCLPVAIDKSIAAARRGRGLPAQPCSALARGDDAALCELGTRVARDGHVLLIVGHGAHGASLDLALRSAVRVLGPSPPIVVFALDEAAAAVAARLGLSTFAAAGIDEPGSGARAAAAGAHALVSAGLRVLLSVGAPLLLAADPFLAVTQDADVTVMTEGWDEVTAGGHVHGFADEAMGWSGYSETLRISYAMPALLLLAPSEGAAELLQRLHAEPSGVTDVTLSEQLFGVAFDQTLRGGFDVRVLRPACFATAERLLRGMAPNAVTVSAHGLHAQLLEVGASQVIVFKV